MQVRIGKFKTAALALAVMALAGFPPAAEAGKAIAAKAVLATDCTNCQTDQANPAGDYSVLGDTDLGYENGNGVQSQILTHNAVYTLDTTSTLVNGVVGAGTRYVRMHFYSPVEGRFPGHVLPPCWGGNYEQWQAVNWSIFSDNSVFFTNMNVGQSYPGFARMDFNVRNRSCDGQIFRFYLRWYSVCIVRTAPGAWQVTSDPCGATVNYGTANLQGQGGRRQSTVNYGDWRMPFKMTLTAQ
ncbi:MAG: hypothetical protein ACRD2R_02015 [Terriglobales bacterium]